MAAPPVRADLLRAAVAAAGLAVACVLLLAAAGDGPPPRWLQRLYALWCLLTPYWWWAEQRLFIPTEPSPARSRMLAEQACSFAVWLGVAIAGGVLLLLRAR